MSLLTVVYNPSVDEEWHLDDLVWDEKNLVKSTRSWAGGKGINVARWLRFLGAKTKLLLALGGDSGRELHKFLRKEGVLSRDIRLTHATRRNVLVTLRNGRQLRFNSAGPRFSTAEGAEILSGIRQAMTRATTMLLSGSLPPGMAAGTYAQLIRIAASKGCRVLLDCDGEALRFAVPARPFLIKPNEFELSQWWGQRIRNLSDVVRAAGAMSEASGGWVMVSRGADPAVLTRAKDRVTWLGEISPVDPLNTSGAGDAMLAGAAFEIERNSPSEQWLKTGMGSGTAATLVRPGLLPTRKVFNSVLRKIRISQQGA